jgi:hypothetical protein
MLLGQKEAPAEGCGYYWNKNFMVGCKIFIYARPHKMIFKYTYFFINKSAL